MNKLNIYEYSLVLLESDLTPYRLNAKQRKLVRELGRDKIEQRDYSSLDSFLQERHKK